MGKASLAAPIEVAVVNAGTTLVMESTRLAVEHELIVPILIGSPASIHNASDAIGWSIPESWIVPAADDTSALSAAIALAQNGRVKALIKGNIHSGSVIRAVLNRDDGLRCGGRLSHVFHMTLPGSDRTICITDGSINVLPTVSEKKEIIRNVVSLMHALGNSEPKVAVLSGVEKEMESLPSSMDAARLVEWAKSGGCPQSIVDGPFALDVAVSPAAAKLKCVESPVAGQADVLLVPNLETGNALAKQMAHFMSAAAAGIVLGAKVPIVMTSRADPPPARLAATAIAVIYSDHCSVYANSK